MAFDLNQNVRFFFIHSDPNGNPVLEKRLTLRNTGNMLTIIHDLSFGQFKCQGQGFSVANCRNIRIEPNEKYNLIILYVRFVLLLLLFMIFLYSIDSDINLIIQLMKSTKRWFYQRISVE